ncbi:MAG: PAS domain-containing protein [Methanomicrobiales archaeon]|nr:PAS domain-containing protein [Methanomicrobiales archaeon]
MISVLYVDDEGDLCELGKLFLEQSGEMSVDTCTSAKEALASPAFSSYDAIISDYLMPEMDGIEFLQAVRADHGSIPFILFTGRGREEVVIAAINHGVDFYLQKGGDPSSQFAELAHKVRGAVERRRAEEALGESEQRQNDIINFLPDATFAIDRSGTVIAWNRAIEEMTGVSAPDMLGKGDYEYALPFYGTRQKILIDLIFEPDEVIATRYSHIIHEKDRLIAETSHPRPKGQLVILSGTASPLYNRQGEVVGAIESIRDITRLRQAEEDAHHARKDWEIIFRAIGHPAIIMDPESRIIDANDAALRATKMSLDDLTGKRCYEAFQTGSAAQSPATCLLEKVKRSKEPVTVEEDMEILGGIFHVSCTPVFTKGGQLRKVILIAMDITEQRKA